MLRNKTVLTVAVILLMTLASLQGILMAAQVQRIHKNQRFVYIDSGTKDGLTVGSIVCIYSSSGKKITCGQVHKTSESKSMVGIDKAKAFQIKSGMEARPMDEERRKR